ncbi:MAG: hypothetical protein ABIR81_01775, partial [Ginsengibacter sp.]
MQSVNDDMDDLFRKAAEHYPLKTDSDNWDSVLNKMDRVESTLPAKNSNNYRKMLWLLMLIPVGWICNNYFIGDDNVTVKTDNTTLEPQTKTASSSAKFKEQNNISPQKLSPSK